ncbi:3',5'-cyclic-AMP phosphodiesterase [Synechococcus sp. W65.1]|uniref:3',5'-cyclic-AMP phosphodiesterase n=1 Tax=Synechococcus sp. W65.1 TaxID=2964526 RepID=UPI0039C2BA98
MRGLSAFGDGKGLSVLKNPAAMTVYVVQISDLHLFAKSHQRLLGVDTEASFLAVQKAIVSLDPLPDVLLLTGDLAQDGSAAAYARLRSYLQTLPIDTYWLAGNHDRLHVMNLELHGGRLHAEKSFSRENWSFILLNSLVPGRDSGYLTDRTLLWLRQELQRSRANHHHVLLALHHPPFSVDSDWLDQSALQQPERLFGVLDEFDHVRLVIFGHVHQELHRRRRGVDYFACPSTCVQFLPKSSQFALEVIPPALRQLWLEPDGSFKTQVQRVEAALQTPNLAAKGY